MCKIKLNNVEVELVTFDKKVLAKINKMKAWLDFKERSKADVEQRLGDLGVAFVNVEVL